MEADVVGESLRADDAFAVDEEGIGQAVIVDVLADLVGGDILGRVLDEVPLLPGQGAVAIELGGAGRVQLDRSLRDLRALYTEVDGGRVFAAGIPWFATLFGRDSLVISLQTLPFTRWFAPAVLRDSARLASR